MLSNLQFAKDEIKENGFVIIRDIFPEEQINRILKTISGTDVSSPSFRISNDLFAIRQFFKYVPGAIEMVMHPGFTQLIEEIFGTEYFVVKSIYFDKPPSSNWFVSYHQDLTISVDQKIPIAEFGPWTIKQGQFAVQPPLPLLQDNFTIRIHLDHTTKENGALKVIPKSHSKGIYRPETINWSIEEEINCEVPKGGIMIMKPLLLHASGRTINNQRRRVIHIEFSRKHLPEGLHWAEQQLSLHTELPNIN